jgi:predicted phosphoribosyltransferase
VLVLGLPRGGMPVAYEVATALHVPLDVFVVRKLGTPGQEELALGAIASGGVRVLNRDVISTIAIGQEEIERITAREASELLRRERDYRGERPPVDVHGRVVILIDDGLATGSTMRAAVAALKHLGPAKTVVAVPVAARESCRAVQTEVDEFVCLSTPESFYAVGQWYQQFEQTSDEEVRQLLLSAERPLIQSL